MRIEPLQWYHMCLVLEEQGEKTGQIKLFFNGVERHRFSAVRALPFNGSLFLGQEQDAFRGGFVEEQAFVGRLAGLTISTEALTSEQVKRLASCSERLSDAGNVQLMEHGNVSKSHLDVCSEVFESQLLLIPILVENDTESASFCRMLHMNPALPKSEAENARFTKVLLANKLSCINTKQVSLAMAWLNNETSPRHFSQEELEYTRNRVKSAKGFKQGGLHLVDNGNWRRSLELAACPLCTGKPEATIFMLGLCEGEAGQPQEYMTFYPRLGASGSLLLVSSKGITIEKLDEWTMRHEPSGVAMATTSLRRSPFGSMLWSVKDTLDFCSSPRKANEPVVITLSNCTMDEFTCGDGLCIPFRDRCSNTYECNDMTDEENCQKNYSSLMPPPQRPFLLNITVSLTKVSNRK